MKYIKYALVSIGILIIGFLALGLIGGFFAETPAIAPPEIRLPKAILPKP